eukprot:m.88865 g.88865  ORF g.88865 m.88865 type:complete len:720 (+) comp11682_c1_seq1:1027-3186(+)
MHDQLFRTWPSSFSCPCGWEIRSDAKGKEYFVDHNTQTTTFQDPRVTAVFVRTANDGQHHEVNVKRESRRHVHFTHCPQKYEFRGKPGDSGAAVFIVCNGAVCFDGLHFAQGMFFGSSTCKIMLKDAKKAIVDSEAAIAYSKLGNARDGPFQESVARCITKLNMFLASNCIKLYGVGFKFTKLLSEIVPEHIVSEFRLHVRKSMLADIHSAVEEIFRIEEIFEMSEQDKKAKKNRDKALGKKLKDAQSWGQDIIHESSRSGKPLQAAETIAALINLLEIKALGATCDDLIRNLKAELSTAERESQVTHIPLLSMTVDETVVVGSVHLTMLASEHWVNTTTRFQLATMIPCKLQPGTDFLERLVSAIHGGLGDLTPTSWVVLGINVRKPHAEDLRGATENIFGTLKKLSQTLGLAIATVLFTWDRAEDATIPYGLFRQVVCDFGLSALNVEVRCADRFIVQTSDSDVVCCSSESTDWGCRLHRRAGAVQEQAFRLMQKHDIDILCCGCRLDDKGFKEAWVQQVCQAACDLDLHLQMALDRSTYFCEQNTYFSVVQNKLNLYLCFGLGQLEGGKARDQFRQLVKRQKGKCQEHNCPHPVVMRDEREDATRDASHFQLKPKVTSRDIFATLVSGLTQSHARREHLQACLNASRDKDDFPPLEEFYGRLHHVTNEMSQTSSELRTKNLYELVSGADDRPQHERLHDIIFQSYVNLKALLAEKQ